jgi:hypothetical protein
MQHNGRHQEEDAGHEAGEGQRHGQEWFCSYLRLSIRITIDFC